VGGAFLFFGYLVIDGLYHRRKWRRLQRKFEESAEPEEAEAPENL
jgi:hypothetical protein